MTRREALRARVRARQRFQRARLVEREFGRALSSVGRQVGSLVRGVAPEGKVPEGGRLRELLRRYADTLRPWATAVVARMQSQVAQRDTSAWEELAREMGMTLRREVEQAPTGQMLREKLAEAVQLITSLPIKAAERVHTLTMEALLGSRRAAEVQREILRTGQVTVGRAKTIARTEVARTASLLTEARAQFVGSEGYFWRSSEDSDVRPFHKKLNGRFIRWDTPPVVDPSGRRAHAGQDINCRCWPEPVLLEEVQLRSLRRAA